MVTAKKFANDSSKQHSVRINGADAIARIRAWLIDSGYAESATRALTRGTPADQAAARTASELPVVRLLLGGASLTVTEANKLFTAKGLKDWIDAGLLEKAKRRVQPLVRITPFRKLFVVSDREWAAEARARPDVVLCLTSGSSWMADFTIRCDSECTLDLGTGTGVQALLAAKHSKQVVATDINPRALEFARFNAALNGIDNIEFVEGDMFKAVEGRTFDLILSNPTFPVSPASSGLSGKKPIDGDESVKQFIEAAPSHLNEHGYAQIVCNWLQRNGESWTDRLSDSLKPAGYDAWVVRGQSSSPADYARRWFSGYDDSDVEKLFGKWMTYCEKQNIASIDGGLITMRRSGRQPNWLRIDAQVPRVFPDAGTQIARFFWLQDFLATVPGHALLNEVLYLSPSIELTQTSKPTITGWKLQSCELTMTRGIGYAANLDPAIARVVAACNGRLQLGRILQAVAMADGENFDAIVAGYLGAIRQLVTLGFLWPARHGIEMESELADPQLSRAALEEGLRAAKAAAATIEARKSNGQEARSIQ